MQETDCSTAIVDLLQLYDASNEENMRVNRDEGCNAEIRDGPLSL